MINKLGKAILYASFIAFLNSCTAPIHTIFVEKGTSISKKELKTLNKSVAAINKYFTAEAYWYLLNSPIGFFSEGVNKDSVTANGFYAYDSKFRWIYSQVLRDTLTYSSYDVKEVLFHESMHRLVAGGKLDVNKFAELYNKMDSDSFPIKVLVEHRLKAHKPDSSGMVLYQPYNERMAYLASYYMLGSASISNELEKYFRPVLRAENRRRLLPKTKGLEGLKLF